MAGQGRHPPPPVRGQRMAVSGHGGGRGGSGGGRGGAVAGRGGGATGGAGGAAVRGAAVRGAPVQGGGHGRWGGGGPSPPTRVLPQRAAKSPAPATKGVTFSEDFAMDGYSPPPRRLNTLSGNSSMSSLSQQSDNAGRAAAGKRSADPEVEGPRKLQKVARSTYATWRQDPYLGRDGGGEAFPVGDDEDMFEDDIDESYPVFLHVFFDNPLLPLHLPHCMIYPPLDVTPGGRHSSAMDDTFSHP